MRRRVRRKTATCLPITFLTMRPCIPRSGGIRHRACALRPHPLPRPTLSPPRTRGQAWAGLRGTKGGLRRGLGRRGDEATRRRVMSQTQASLAATHCQPSFFRLHRCIPHRAHARRQACGHVADEAGSPQNRHMFADHLPYHAPMYTSQRRHAPQPHEWPTTSFPPLAGDQGGLQRGLGNRQGAPAGSLRGGAPQIGDIPGIGAARSHEMKSEHHVGAATGGRPHMVLAAEACAAAV
jgi:hypothetical protein